MRTRFSSRARRRSAFAFLVAGALMASAPAATGVSAQEAFTGLKGPRGVAVGPSGKLIVTQANGSFSRIVRAGAGAGKVVRIGKVPAGFLAPAVDVNRKSQIFVLTVGGQPGAEGAGTLYRFTPGKGRELLADIQAFQARKPNHDPFNLEGNPGESNPYGVAGLPGGGALVVDAAGNDLLKVGPGGKITTVARFKPRTVKMPKGYEDERGLPPAGTPIPSEAVPAAVTVGRDGSYYVGELRGFPGTPGKSQIWRIRKGAQNAVCNPKTPRRGACTRYADRLTSVVGLAAGRGGSLYALELSKKSWFALEMEVEGADVGSLIRIGHDRNVRVELAKGKLRIPGGVAVGPKGEVFVSGPIFGRGEVTRVK